MSQRTIFIYGLIAVLVVLFLLRVWMVNHPAASGTNIAPVSPPLPADDLAEGEQKMIRISAAKRDWTPIGTGPMILTASGTVDLGGGLRTAPDDTKRAGDERLLVPELSYGMLIGKIGENGKPFRIGRGAQIGQKQTVYLVVNDADHSDNSGEYIVTIRRGYRRSADEP